MLWVLTCQPSGPTSPTRRIIQGPPPFPPWGADQYKYPLGGWQTGLDGGGPDRGGPDRSDIRQTKGSRIKDHGPYFGTNEHPRRDTDVILRQSKAPIEIFNF